jgi:hypothetical protein
MILNGMVRELSIILKILLVSGEVDLLGKMRIIL